MLRSRFVSRLYWALVVLVFVTLAVLTLYVGVFGQGAQKLTQDLLKPLIDFYKAYKVPFDIAFLIIGTSVPAVTGGLAILKGFFYAEMNLPRRSQELVDEARDRHLHSRPELVAYVRGPKFKTRDFLVPTILANPLAQVLQLFGWSSIRTKARDVATSVPQLVAELEALEVWKSHTENRKFTAHLLRGLSLSAQARQESNGSWERKRSHEGALKEFEDALGLRGNDLDALDGAAEQAAILSETAKQLQFTDRIIDAAEGDANRVRRAKAQRQSALLMNDDPDQRVKDAARRRLVDITEVLDEERPAERIELAESFLLLGVIQARRGRVPTARRMLRRARILFGENSEGAKRAEDELNRIDPPNPTDSAPQ